MLIYRKSHNTEAALADNQRYVYAYVSDIQGNEITYMEMDESVVTAYLEQQEEASTTDDAAAETTEEDVATPEETTEEDATATEETTEE